MALPTIYRSKQYRKTRRAIPFCNSLLILQSADSLSAF